MGARSYRFVIECRWVYGSSCYGSPYIWFLRKHEKIGAAGRRDVVVVGIPLPAQVVIGVPGKRLAITFSVIDIFACGFLQHVKHRLDIIL